MASFARPPIDPGSQWRAGHVDAVVAWDGKIEIEGWAFDPVNNAPVEQVIAVTGSGEIIFCANLATHRIDVANALQQPAGWRYGWWMLLDHQLWRDADRLSIYGYSHGSIYLLNKGVISLSGGTVLWPEQCVPRPSVNSAQA